MRINFYNVFILTFWHVNDFFFIYLLPFLLIRRVFRKGYLERPELRVSLLIHKEWTDSILIPSIIYLLITATIQCLIFLPVQIYLIHDSLPRSEWFEFIMFSPLHMLNYYLLPIFFNCTLALFTMLLVSHPRLYKKALGIIALVAIPSLIMKVLILQFDWPIYQAIDSLFQAFLLSSSQTTSDISKFVRIMSAMIVSEFPFLLTAFFGWRWLAKNWSHCEWRVE